MEKLKPCPFCGENGEEIQDRSYYLPNNIYIGIFYCRNCGGAIIDTDKNHSWLDKAKLWNNRFCADGKGGQMMPDMEKVIKGIQECDLNGGLIGNCPYKGILALLKEQEAEIRQLRLALDVAKF